jgi:hypothetical protein
MYIIRNIFLLTLTFSFSQAELNTTTPFEFDYIDETHKTISNKIIEWSSSIDTTLSSWGGNDDNNLTTETERKQSVRPPNKRVKSVDSFFQNKKYLDETEETFVTLRLDSEFKSRESDDFRVKLGGQVALSKSKKRFKFFIDNATSDNVGNIMEEDASSSPELGFHYFAPDKYGIESKYSLGMRGIDPFVRARYYMTFETGAWYIDPSQTFKYSAGDKFEEETNIYFDRHFDDLSLFRFVMHRKTEEEKKGMDYAFTFQYYWSPIENIGLRVSQSFIGNTKYPYIIDSTIEPIQTENYSGIYDYVSSFSLRHNIWRKWFFYEVRPGVNFHKIHDYEPNYTLRVFLDFHFGKYP